MKKLYMFTGAVKYTKFEITVTEIEVEETEKMYKSPARNLCGYRSAINKNEIDKLTKGCLSYWMVSETNNKSDFIQKIKDMFQKKIDAASTQIEEYKGFIDVLDSIDA